MKQLFTILFFILLSKPLQAQLDSMHLLNTSAEQQLENLAEAMEDEPEDDSYLQQFSDYKRRPLNLNSATESDLKTFFFLKPLQIQSLLLYRQLLGRLIDIYELQAVPGWDIETIQKIRPFITVTNAVTIKEDFSKRLSAGEASVLARVSQILERSKGFEAKDSTGPKYKGGRQRIFLRYRYQYKNLLQYGLVADKDAGEQLFRGSQKLGFDFYSFHLFARDFGVIRHLALGDFTVNMGQGLISWQSMGFRKSGDAMGIKRQADILRPYNSAGEFNFHRGLGLTVKKNKWQVTAFISDKKLSANAIVDTVNYEDYVSSLQTSGYHRTQSEIDDKAVLKQFTIGGNLSYQLNRLHIGFNAVHYALSKPLQKGPEPYNRYAIGGNKITNASLDYGYTFRNTHLFGELATDAQGDLAMVHGLMMSLDAKADFSLLYRNISPAYGSLYGNAFTESTTPINENGLYSGLTIRPATGFKIDLYADFFSFPWLRYRVDQPAKGADYLVQFGWKPNKQLELYTRYTHQSKAINLSETNLPAHLTRNRPKQNWRTHLSYKISPAVMVRSRAELLWFDKQSDKPENGILLFTDLLYKPMMAPFSVGIRLQYFETDSYDSRMYAFENDVLYSFSIPVFYEKGYRYYLNLNYDLSRRLSAWFRISQTISPGKTSIGSGNDEISGNRKTELKLQALYLL
ncbi:MAG: helix-hairpin-helix domain-containing protein [Bacteroidota bacterium]